MPIIYKIPAGLIILKTDNIETVIIESKPLSGDELVIVAFEDVGIKRLIAGSAKLKIEDGG